MAKSLDKEIKSSSLVMYNPLLKQPLDAAGDFGQIKKMKAHATLSHRTFTWALHYSMVNK